MLRTALLRGTLLSLMEKSDLSCKFGYRFFIKRYINELMCMQDTSITTDDFAVFRHLLLKMFSAETHKYG